LAAPAAWKLSPRKSWWSPTAWQVRREIKRAIRQRSLLHLRLDALRLIEAPPGALALVSSLLRYIAVKRDAGQLAIETIAISQCMRSTAEPRFPPAPSSAPRRDGGWNLKSCSALWQNERKRIERTTAAPAV